MVYGDPHYKTFDGKLYTFHGVGKYQLVSDCANNTFTIRVANVHSKSLPRRSQNRPSRTSTKRIAIRYGNVRLNLQQRLRLKYNGQLVKLPFDGDDKVKIKKEGENLLVVLQNGIKILWSGKSFLEITLPAIFKNKVCGLCGNFNRNAQDDFRMRKGKIAKDNEVQSFGASWCIGSRINCTRQSKQFDHGTCLSPRNDQKYCKYMTDPSVVGNCNSVINVNKYYKTCKMDMCNCGTEKCYCENLMAYLRECQRLGVQLPNWQKNSLCYASAPKRRKSISREIPIFSRAEIEKYQKLMKNKSIKHRKPLPTIS